MTVARRVVDVEALICEVTSLLERSIDKRVELRVQLLGEQRCRVLGDASFLSSALLNLGLNARGCHAARRLSELRNEPGVRVRRAR